MNKADKWDERYRSSELTWSAGPNLLFAEQVRGWEPGRALDVGSGEGRNAIWLAEQGWRVDAVDFSAVGIEKAARIAERRGVTVNWLVADVASHTFESRAYDLVFVLYLHTSPAERDAWLPAVIGAVSPGGHFLYIAHDPANVSGGVGGPQDPDLLPGVDDICAGLGGFDVRRAEVVQRAVQADPGHGGPDSGTALDTLVLAKRHPS